MPSERVRLNQLATLMGKSRWQQEELASIKSRPGYKMFQLVVRALDVVCCSNLYSYISAQSCHSADEISADAGARASCLLPALAPAASSTDYPSNKLAKHMAPVDELHERKLTGPILISRLMLVLCIASKAGIILSICFQYRLDYYLLHLHRFNTSQQFAGQHGAPLDASRFDGLSYKQVLALEEELRPREQEARALTKISGSFLRDWPFLCETVYLLMILLCSCAYSGPMLYYHRRGSFDFHYLRLALDWDQEQVNCNRMVAYLIKRFTKSSENFLLFAQDHRRGFRFKPNIEPLDRRAKVPLTLARGFGDHGSRSRHISTDLSPTGRSNISTARNHAAAGLGKNAHHVKRPLTYRDEHKWVIGELKRIALAGRLQPLDRSDVDDMDRRMGLYAILMTFTLCSLFIYVVIQFGFLLPLDFNSYDFMDLVSFLEFLVLTILTILSGVFYLGIMLFFCREQVTLMDKLRANIASFIASNRRLLDRCPARRRSSRSHRTSTDLALTSACDGWSSEQLDELYASINSDLLLILMHYRIFTTQCRPARRTLDFIIFCCTGVMLSFPIIGRLHVPYIHVGNSRIMSILFSLISIGTPDVSLVPVCHANSRSLGLCRSLWSLMATLEDIKEHPKFGCLLNEHSVWLLRKELSHPERLKSQFAFVTFGAEFTYAQLLRIHFWLGLVVLLSVYELDATLGPSEVNAASLFRGTRTGIFGGLLSDPLGIASDYKI